MILPVPNIKGGAVEELITKLIIQNENVKGCIFDLYTVKDKQLDNFHLEFTNIIQVPYNRITRCQDRIRDKIKRVLNNGYICRKIDYSVARLVSQKKYDAIVIENMSSLYRLVRNKVKCPVFFHIHNLLDIYRTKADLMYMVKRDDKVISIGNYMSELVKKNVPGVQVEILYNCLARDRYSNTSLDIRKNLRNELNIPDDAVVFMYSGRIIPEKGVLELIKAFQKVYKMYSNSFLIIVGSAMFEKKNKKLRYQSDVLKAAEDNNHILLTGFVQPEKMLHYYSCADVGVVPSMWEEPFGMVTLEMMQYGLPLIVTNKGELPYIIDNNCAITIEVGPEFLNSLQDAMIRLAESPDLRNTMGKASLERMNQKTEYDDKGYLEKFFHIVSD